MKHERGRPSPSPLRFVISLLLTRNVDTATNRLVTLDSVQFLLVQAGCLNEAAGLSKDFGLGDSCAVAVLKAAVAQTSPAEDHNLRLRRWHQTGLSQRSC